MCRAFPVDRVFSVFNLVARVSSVFSCSCVECFSVARVSGVLSCSCVQRFQLLVCPAFSVARAARVPSAFGCSCVERSQLIVCWALSVCTFTLFMRLAFSVARMSIERFQLLHFRFSCVKRFQLLVCRAFFSCSCVERFSVARGSCVFVTSLFAVARLAESAFNLRCLEVLPLLILGYLVCLILPL